MKSLTNLILILFISSFAFGAPSGGSGTQTNPFEISFIKVIEIQKEIEVPVYVKKTFEVPQIKLIPKTLFDVEIKKKTVEVNDVTLIPVEKEYEVPKIVYKEQIITVPKADKDQLREEIKVFLTEALKEEIAALNIREALKAAIDGAIENVVIKNAIVQDVTVTNAIIKEKEVLVERPVYKDKEIINPIIREQVIKVKKLILQDGREIE